MINTEEARSKSRESKLSIKSKTADSVENLETCQKYFDQEYGYLGQFPPDESTYDQLL
jgi:hypothetical protein